MYKLKIIEELKPEEYEVIGSGTEYYSSHPVFKPGGRLFFNRTYSGFGVIEQFRAGKHEDYGRNHINYEIAFPKTGSKEGRYGVMYNRHIRDVETRMKILRDKGLKDGWDEAALVMDLERDYGRSCVWSEDLKRAVNKTLGKKLF